MAQNDKICPKRQKWPKQQKWPKTTKFAQNDKKAQNDKNGPKRQKWPLWNADRPAMFGHFWSKMDHFWAIPSHERWTPK